MATFIIWNKLYLHRKKSLIGISLFFSIIFSTSGQRLFTKNLPKYDSKKLHYGFFLATHVSNYRLVYSDDFVYQLDTLQSIRAVLKPGFGLGFIANYKLADQFDIRFIPSVSFYEDLLRYQFKNKQVDQVLESTFLDFSILVKYKSIRRKNTRVYVVAGCKPSIQISNKKPSTNNDRLFTKNSNFTVEYGVGMDLYFKLFKFSPELRFSHGIPNMLTESSNIYSIGIQKLTTHMVTLYLFFE